MKMASRSTDLISKKHAFLSFFAVVLHDYTLFSTTKTSNFLVTRCFYGWIIVYAYPIFCFLCSCSLLFFTGPHLHLVGRSLLVASISYFLTAANNKLGRSHAGAGSLRDTGPERLRTRLTFFLCLRLLFTRESDLFNHEYDYRLNWTPLSPVTITHFLFSHHR